MCRMERMLVGFAITKIVSVLVKPLLVRFGDKTEAMMAQAMEANEGRVGPYSISLMALTVAPWKRDEYHVNSTPDSILKFRSKQIPPYNGYTQEKQAAYVDEPI